MAKKDLQIKCDAYYLPENGSNCMTKDYLKMVNMDQVLRIPKKDIYPYLSTVTPKFMA